MKKYIVKVPYMPSLGLHSYYTVSTKEEAESIAEQCINAEIIEEAQDEEVVEERAEFKREIEKLKFQLEKRQPEIPEFMANYIEAAKEDFWTLFSAMDDSNLSSRVGDWLKGGNFRNQEIFAQAWLNGYTVKEKWFYLKHIDFCERDKDYDWYMIKHSDGPLNHLRVEKGALPPTVDTYFTQQEIDSMAAESYEQIEVQE